MTKYRPLERYFEKLNKERIRLSFVEIESIIGDKLPASATQYSAWWANDKTHTQADAWLDSGWKKVKVSFSEEWVEFAKILQSLDC